MPDEDEFLPVSHYSASREQPVVALMDPDKNIFVPDQQYKPKQLFDPVSYATVEQAKRRILSVAVSIVVVVLAVIVVCTVILSGIYISDATRVYSENVADDIERQESVFEEYQEEYETLTQQLPASDEDDIATLNEALVDWKSLYEGLKTDYSLLNRYDGSTLDEYDLVLTSAESTIASLKQRLIDAVNAVAYDWSYDESLFDGEVVKEDAELEASSVYHTYMLEAISDLNAIWQVQTQNSLFDSDVVSEIVIALDEKMTYWKALYVEALARETEEEAIDEITEELQQQFDEEKQQLIDEYNELIEDLNTTIEALQEQMESLQTTIDEQESQIDTLTSALEELESNQS